MTVAPKNENERIIARIEAVESSLNGESARVLAYIKEALTPASIARRPEWDQSVTHLYEVANMHLKPYEKEANRD